MYLTLKKRYIFTYTCIFISAFFGGGMYMIPECYAKKKQELLVFIIKIIFALPIIFTV